MKELTLAKLAFIFDRDDADAFNMDTPIHIVDDDNNYYELTDVCSQGISLLYNIGTHKADGIYIKKVDAKKVLDEMTITFKSDEPIIFNPDA